MKSTRWIFLIAGILGLLLVIPVAYNLITSGQELLPNFESTGLFVYVFLFQYTCWQIFFFIISRDPARYRPMMILAFLVEVSMPFNSIWLYFYGLKPWIFLTIVSLIFALLFLIAFWMIGRESSQANISPSSQAKL